MVRAVGSCSITLNTVQSIEAVSTGTVFLLLLSQSIEAFLTDYASFDDFVLPVDFKDVGVLSILVGTMCTVSWYLKSTEPVVCKLYFVTIFLIVLRYRKQYFFCWKVRARFMLGFQNKV